VFSSPGSVQRPHPPILIGGLSNAALRRVVKQGNGWLAVSAPPEKLEERLAVLRQMAAEAGRSPKDISLVYKMFLGIDEPKTGPFDTREPGTGSLAQITDDVKRLRELGFDKIIVRYRGNDAAEQMRQIDRFVSEIAPKV